MTKIDKIADRLRALGVAVHDGRPPKTFDECWRNDQPIDAVFKYLKRGVVSEAWVGLDSDGQYLAVQHPYNLQDDF